MFRFPPATLRREAFPSKQLAAISAKLMEKEPILALQYSTTEGYPPLLQHLKAYMKSSRNIGTEDDGVLRHKRRTADHGSVHKIHLKRRRKPLL